MANRVLILVRHGQYHLEPAHGRYGRLTALGARQATRLGKRLAAYPIDALYSSTAPRAIDTANCLAEHLPGVRHRRSPLLLEVLPTVLAHMTREQRARVPLHRARADRAFARFFRATRGQDRYEVLVCHGNLIRYLLRRALEDPPHKWWRCEVMHCGVSVVAMPSNAPARVVALNDVGHLPRTLQTLV